jgi:VWFA-related protein
MRDGLRGVVGVAVGLVAVALQNVPAAQTALRSSVELVTVDLVVRDRSGAFVPGLSADDFDVREDGILQQVTLFDVTAARSTPPSTSRAPGSSIMTAARRSPNGDDGTGAMILVLDLVAMRPDDIERAVSAAIRYVDRGATLDLLLGLATIGPGLEWIVDLTSDRTAIRAALDRLTPAHGLAAERPAARTLATDEAASVPIDGDGWARPDASADALPLADDHLGLLTNDTRLRAITALAGELERFGRKKAVVYFSGGLPRAGHDNQVELRTAVNAAVRANMAIYPVDTGGLQTLTPGGDATQSRPAGVDLFSGRDMTGQLDDLARSQETLMTLAADTGGRAHLDTNDFGEAFARAADDLSSYYLLGYQSTNQARDGRFRRITVQVKRPGFRVETRAGYYADLDFAHASRADREAHLAAELAAPISSTEVPIALSTAWFRLTDQEYEVPLAIAIPGWSIAVPRDVTQVPLDVVGEVRDERQRPVSRLRQTATITLGSSSTLADQMLVYRARFRLPPGRYVLKLVVRENIGGRIGSHEVPLVVPDLSRRPLEASTIVLQVAANPTTVRRRDPHPTRVVDHDQPLAFYVEAYGAAGPGASVNVRAGLTCYRDLRKVLETPLESRTSVNAARRALPIVIRLPPGALTSGLHTCQVNVIDDAARRFVFPRITFAVR